MDGSFHGMFSDLATGFVSDTLERKGIGGVYVRISNMYDFICFPHCHINVCAIESGNDTSRDSGFLAEDVVLPFISQ